MQFIVSQVEFVFYVFGVMDLISFDYYRLWLNDCLGDVRRKKEEFFEKW